MEIEKLLNQNNVNVSILEPSELNVPIDDKNAKKTKADGTGVNVNQVLNELEYTFAHSQVKEL